MSPAPAPSAASTATVAASPAASGLSLLPAIAADTAAPSSFETMLAGSPSGKASASVKDKGTNAGEKGKDERKDAQDESLQATSLAGALLATQPLPPPPPVTLRVKAVDDKGTDSDQPSDPATGSASALASVAPVAATPTSAVQSWPGSTTAADGKTPARPSFPLPPGPATATAPRPPASKPLSQPAAAQATVQKAVPPIPASIAAHLASQAASLPPPASAPAAAPAQPAPTIVQSPSIDFTKSASPMVQEQPAVNPPVLSSVPSSTAHGAVATALPADAGEGTPVSQDTSKPAPASSDPASTPDLVTQSVDPTVPAPVNPPAQPAETASSLLSSALQSVVTQSSAAINAPANSAGSAQIASPARSGKSEKIAPATASRRSDPAASEKIESPAKADESLLGGVIARVRKAAGTTVAKGAADMVSTTSNSSFTLAGHDSASEADSLQGALAQAGDAGDQSSDSSDSHREPEFVLTTTRADRSEATTFTAPISPAGPDFTTASAVVKSSTPSTVPTSTLEALQTAVEHLRTQGDSTVQLKLSLEGAGQVDIQLSLRANSIHATVATSSPELQEALSRHWSQLQSSNNGSDQSVRIADLKFTPAPDQGGSSFDFNRQSSSRQQQQQSARGESPFAFSSPSTSTNRSNPPTPAARASRSGLNLWA